MKITKENAAGELQNARRELRRIQGESDYLLDLFGDDLGKQLGIDLDGMEAIWFYLVEKYRWTPAAARAMTTDDIRLALTQEMSGWTIQSKRARLPKSLPKYE